jgi:hypothetical protein
LESFRAKAIAEANAALCRACDVVQHAFESAAA